MKINLKFLFIIIVVLISIRFWSFQVVPSFIYSYLEGISYILILFLLIILHKSKYNIEMNFEKNIKYLIFFSFLSTIPAYFFHGQTIYFSVFKLRFLALWGIYFLLHHFKIEPKKIIHFIIIVGFVWAAITIIQQYTYPNYIFYSRSDKDQSISRDGIYRFMVFRHQFGIFMILYSYQQYLKKYKSKYLLLLLVGLIGLYYFGTRQFFVTTLLMLLLMTFSKKGLTKYIIIFISAFVVFIFFQNFQIFYYDLFSSLVDRTIAEVNNPNYIRFLSGYFFLFKYWPHWLTILFGNGLEYEITAYGKEIDLLKNVYNYYRSDLGILGTTNIFGLFYSINLIILLFQAIKKSTKDYIKYFFVSVLVLIPLSDYSYNQTVIPFFCMLLYLIDYENFEENKASNLTLKKNK